MRRPPTHPIPAALSVGAVLLLSAWALEAQEDRAPRPGEPAWDEPFVEVLSPGTSYDPAIPTLAQVAGHDLHQEITPPDEIAAYMEALAAAAPERTHLFEYAESHEGRPLQMLVIGARERISDLDRVREGLRALAEPDRHDEGELERLVGELPVVTALLHGVHGNEISSSGAGMALAYHLLAAEDDARTDSILARSLVLVDPNQNPDGRYRFVSRYAQGRADPPRGDRFAAGHDEPWPGGRTNHYLFDLNRDWFMQAHPESRGRVAALLSFQPHVVVDLHEMGGDATYYFPPAAVPGNTYVTDRQETWYDSFGRNNADRFDERGFSYFTREIFDAFYPGYGASWPTTHGALGMTFEQASARGLVFRRSDGTLLTYGDGILHHWTAAFETAATAARNREELLRAYLDFRRGGIEMGRNGPVRTYLLHSEHDPALARKLARVLVRNGIRVERADEPVVADGRTLPAGETWVVPMDQPAHRLARNLLDPHTPMNPGFVEEQRERRARRLPDEIYDVTGWSLPLLWDVDAVALDGPVGVTTTPVRDPEERGPPGAGGTGRPAGAGSDLPPARVGYLVPWNSAGAAAVAEALREGLAVRVAGGPFTLDGRRFGVGTALLRTGENGPDLGDRLGPIAERHGAEAVAVEESFVDQGISLGSSRFGALREPPSVVLVWDEPTGAYSAGWARFNLEERYGVAVTPIRASTLPRTVLSDYDVIVLPDGRYGGAWSDEFLHRLEGWIEDGGTLVTVAEASRWAARTGLLATPTELRGGAPAFAPGEGARRGGGEGSASGEPPEQPIDYLEAIDPDVELPEPVPGAILNVILEPDHWLAAGTDGRIGVVAESDRIFTPITLDRGTNVGRYAGLDDLVAGGIVWDDVRPQLAHKPWLIHQPRGRGQVVSFAEDPNYRAYVEAGQLVFLNAVLLGARR